MIFLAVDPVIYIGAGTLFTGAGTLALALLYGGIQARSVERQARVSERTLDQNERLLMQTVKRDSFDILERTVARLQVMIDSYDEKLRSTSAALAVCEDHREQGKHELNELRERVALMEQNHGS